MTVVIDTTAIIAVLTDEPHQASMIAATRGASFLAPASLRWEVGNAFSAMLEWALQVAAGQRIYAYDACMLASAMQCGAPLLTLDRRLGETAKRVALSVLEVTP